MGYIPTKIIYYDKDPSTINFNGESIEVIPSFPILIGGPNKSSEQNQKITATWWSDDDNPTELENIPRVYKVVNYDVRSKGNKVFKIIDDNNRLFDLSVDNLIEIIFNHGVNKGGTLNGKFIWVVDTVKKLVEISDNIKKYVTPKKIKVKDLIPGTLYKNKRKTYLYVGKYWITDKHRERVNKHILIEGYRYHDRFSYFWFYNGKGIPSLYEIVETLSDFSLQSFIESYVKNSIPCQALDGQATKFVGTV